MVAGVTQQRVLEELQGLEPGLWFEVLDFIDYLKERRGRERAWVERQETSARDLLQSGLVGLWADRDDMGDGLEFARRLRLQAEHRLGSPDAFD